MVQETFLLVVYLPLLFEFIAHDNIGMQSTLREEQMSIASEHESMQGMLVCECVSMLAREPVSMQARNVGTWARKYAKQVSTYILKIH